MLMGCYLLRQMGKQTMKFCSMMKRNKLLIFAIIGESQKRYAQEKKPDTNEYQSAHSLEVGE